ncbi:MAG: hypothetical protein V1834_03565, partial [Candidatus Micrarchaeota archaeon]
MKIMNKELMAYWKVIQLPVYASVALLVVVLVLPLLSDLLRLISLAIWVWAGWRAFKEFKYDLEHSAVAGAIGGLAVGFMGAVVSLIFYYAFGLPALDSMGIYGAVASGKALINLLSNLIT